MFILPNELVEYIISFIFDTRGYNMIEYKKRKDCDIPRRMRINKEFNLWKKNNLSIIWLKPCNTQKSRNHKFLTSLKEGNAKVFYHTGFYTFPYEENIQIID